MRALRYCMFGTVYTFAVVLVVFLWSFLIGLALVFTSLVGLPPPLLPLPDTYSPVANEQCLQVDGAVLVIEVYSHSKMRAHTPIGVIVINCKEIPTLAPEEKELVEPSQK